MIHAIRKCLPMVVPFPPTSYINRRSWQHSIIKNNSIGGIPYPKQVRCLSSMLRYEECTVYEKQVFIENEVLPLIRDATPRNEEQLCKIFRQKGGTSAALALRRDIERIYKSEWDGHWTLLKLTKQEFLAVDQFLKRWLMAVFCFDTIRLERITFDSSARTLEVVAKSENVHKIETMYELKKRLRAGRRCYGLFHDLIPQKPLAFIHVALTSDLADSMRSLYTLKDETAPTHMMFYSINSCVPSLRGLGIGQLLIQRAALELQQQFPSATTFSTLSPVPGFRTWLRTISGKMLERDEYQRIRNSADLALKQPNEDSDSNKSHHLHSSVELPPEYSEMLRLATAHDRAAAATFEQIATLAQQPVTDAMALSWLAETLGAVRSKEREEWWVDDPVLVQQIKEPLMWLVCHYITTSKITRADAVSQFHLGNGAIFHSVRWFADTSVEGLAASGGVMVNYLYDLDVMHAYAKRYRVDADFLPIDSDVRAVLQGQYGVHREAAGSAATKTAAKTAGAAATTSSSPASPSSSSS